jgi:hypothetical protein
MAIQFFSVPVGTSSVASLGDTGDSNYAYVTIETDSIRVRFDGGDPTTVGHLCPIGATIILEGARELNGFRCIAQNIGATLRVSHQRRRRS